MSGAKKRMKKATRIWKPCKWYDYYLNKLGKLKQPNHVKNSPPMPNHNSDPSEVIRKEAEEMYPYQSTRYNSVVDSERAAYIAGRMAESDIDWDKLKRKFYGWQNTYAGIISYDKIFDFFKNNLPTPPKK